MNVSFSELKQKICKYCGITDIDKAKNQRRNYDYKLDYLLAFVLLRDKAEYKEDPSKQQSPILIPQDDVPVIAAFIIRAISDEKEDEIICRWFNSKCLPSDYKKNIAVYNDIDSMFHEMLSLPTEFRGFIYGEGICFNFKTYFRWIRHLKYILNYDQSLFLQKASEQIQGIYEGLVALRPPVSLKEMEEYYRAWHNNKEKPEDLISKETQQEHNPTVDTAENIKRIISELKKEDSFDNPEFSKSISEHIRYSTSESEDYTQPINSFLEDMERRIKTDVCRELINYANLKKTKSLKNITESVDHYPITASELHHFLMLYRIIKKEPDLISSLEQKTGQENLLEFFKIEI